MGGGNNTAVRFKDCTPKEPGRACGTLAKLAGNFLETTKTDTEIGLYSLREKRRRGEEEKRERRERREREERGERGERSEERGERREREERTLETSERRQEDSYRH
jgi:hypothetical protein